jgi:outer membrane lipopolysaccharide assembly protein LptE/RlpB
MLLLTGCGYHTAGSATHIPAGISTLAIPTFKNNTQSYHTEVAFTQALLHEMNTRTRYRIVNSDNPANSDAILRGTILTQSAAPLTYDSSSGQTSSYVITITARVTLTSATGRVLYQNGRFTFREQYQSTQDLSAFIQEDSPAVARLARNFAQAMVSDILESF